MENVYMCNALTVHLNDEPIYDIFFANDFNSLPELLAGQGIADRRVCIVTESNVAPLYLDEIRNQLDGKCKELISIIFEAGESQKNLDTVKMIYEKLILAKFDRKDLLVALGGGVTGDITVYIPYHLSPIRPLKHDGTAARSVRSRH